MNKENQTKKSNYEKLFNKITIALINEFYFEAIWISYSIIEDRLLSALKKCGGELAQTGRQRGNPIMMLGPKIQEIKFRLPSQIRLREVFFDSILDDISDWAKSRNKLMHALAEETQPISVLEAEVEETAKKGQELSKLLAAKIRKLSSRVKKHGLN